MLGASLLTLTPGAIEKPARSPAFSRDVVERGTLRLHYVQKPIGYERYQIGRQGDTLTLTSDFDFTDRGGRVQLAATLRTRPTSRPSRSRRRARVIASSTSIPRSASTARTRSSRRMAPNRACRCRRRSIPSTGMRRSRRRCCCCVTGRARPAACHADRPRAPDERRVHRSSRQRSDSHRPTEIRSNATSSTASSGAARRSGSTIAAGSPPRSRAPAG